MFLPITNYTILFRSWQPCTSICSADVQFSHPPRRRARAVISRLSGPFFGGIFRPAAKPEPFSNTQPIFRGSRFTPPQADAFLYYSGLLYPADVPLSHPPRRTSPRQHAGYPSIFTRLISTAFPVFPSTSSSTPESRTGPRTLSNRVGSPVLNRRMAGSGASPSAESNTPHIPA